MELHVLGTTESPKSKILNRSVRSRIGYPTSRLNKKKFGDISDFHVFHYLNPNLEIFLMNPFINKIV